MVFQSPVGVFYQNGYRGRYRRRYHWFNVLLPPTKEKVYTIASDVCLSVCLLARLLKNACVDLDEMCVSTDPSIIHHLFKTWTNWLTFEPDPDHSPDAGTGLLSTISYRLRNFAVCLGCQRAALLRGILRRENPTYTYWRRTARASRGFKMVLFTVPSEDLCRR